MAIPVWLFQCTQIYGRRGFLAVEYYAFNFRDKCTLPVLNDHRSSYAHVPLHVHSTLLPHKQLSSLSLIYFYVLYSVMDKAVSWTFCTTNLIISKYIWRLLFPWCEVAAIGYVFSDSLWFDPNSVYQYKVIHSNTKAIMLWEFQDDRLRYSVFPVSLQLRFLRKSESFTFLDWSDKSTEFSKYSIFLLKIFFHLLCHNQTLFNDVRCLGSILLPFL